MCAPFLPDTGDPIALAGPEAAAGAPPVPDRAPPGCHPVRRPRRRARALRTPWTRAVDTSQRRLVLVGGDPGIGKSRPPPSSPATSTTRATVLFGRCYEENVVPYQPFVEAVEQYLRHGDPAEVRADLVRSGTLLAAWSPTSACGSRTPGRSGPSPTPSAYLMFEAVDALLAGIAKHRTVAGRTTSTGPIAPRWHCSATSPATRCGAARRARHLSHERGGRRPSAARIIADLRHDGVAEDIALGA